MKAVLSNRIYVEVTPEQKEYILKELYYVIPPLHSTGKPVIIQNAIPIRDNILSIPAGRQDLIPNGHIIVDKRIVNPQRFPSMKDSITLRDDQEGAVSSRSSNYVVVAPPAWGKTFTGVELIRRIGNKALIIVHTNFLLNQWVGEIRKCLNIEPGVVGDRRKETDAPIIVGMIQTLSKMNIYKDFGDVGTVVVDECHHIAASTFKQVVDRCKAKYKIGLTATPKRKDRKHMLIFDYLGTDIYKATDINAMMPTIMQIETNIRFPGNSHTPWANRVNSLNADTRYIDLLADAAVTEAIRGHKVLLLSDRLETLVKLSDIIGDRSVLIDSKTKPDERTHKLSQIRSGEKDIVLGSLKIFCEGISENILSCLILGAAINNEPLLEQVVGRVTRIKKDEHGVSMKKDPVVVDFKLQGATGNRQAAARYSFFLNKGWNVKCI